MQKNKITYFIRELNLHYINQTFIFNEENRIITEICEYSIFQLDPISKAEIIEKRISRIPAFILKLDADTFYYTEIPKETRFNTSESKKDTHLCQTCKKFLKCRKVLDGSVVENRARTNSEISAISNSSRIEKFRFITEGFETFNVINTNFKVKECSNYEYKDPFKTRRKLSTAKKDIDLVLLAQFLNPDIDDLDDLIKYLDRKL